MNQSKPIKPLTVETLKPFPIPKYLESLPPNVLDEFIQLYSLVSGYLESLPSYKTFTESITTQINYQITKLNEIITIFDEYEIAGNLIKEQIDKINKLYQEFLNLEVYQYQLLSSNFNQQFLKKKLEAMTRNTNEESLRIAQSLKQLDKLESEFNELLKDFKNSRSLYHMRREKLYRWDEERVTGLI
ncbi:uncharacterized protein PRCAT00003821001 [Priceomyces carsonii]|uniref:uncharacterized protein n=1 Tax=Priceomyces carsonii TaxID=28549 RepID=UPI002ED9FB29|nr:unnamed protein product [Priceomyces carsonii]